LSITVVKVGISYITQITQLHIFVYKAEHTQLPEYYDGMASSRFRYEYQNRDKPYIRGNKFDEKKTLMNSLLQYNPSKLLWILRLGNAPNCSKVNLVATP
jgi:hypothetical protein